MKIKNILCPLCKWKSENKCKAKDSKIPEVLLTCLAAEFKKRTVSNKC